jgi:hypothetical protein
MMGEEVYEIDSILYLVSMLQCYNVTIRKMYLE